MAKRPTPKQRKPKSRGRTQHSVFQMNEVRRLSGLAKSPYGKPMTKKKKSSKALENITKIKA